MCSLPPVGAPRRGGVLLRRQTIPLTFAIQALPPHAAGLAGAATPKRDVAIGGCGGGEGGTNVVHENTIGVIAAHRRVMGLICVTRPPPHVDTTETHLSENTQVRGGVCATHPPATCPTFSRKVPTPSSISKD